METAVIHPDETFEELDQPNILKKEIDQPSVANKKTPELYSYIHEDKWYDNRKGIPSNARKVTVNKTQRTKVTKKMIYQDGYCKHIIIDIDGEERFYSYDSKKSLKQNLRFVLKTLRDSCNTVSKDTERLFKRFNKAAYRERYERKRNKKYGEQVIQLKRKIDHVTNGYCEYIYLTINSKEILYSYEPKKSLTQNLRAMLETLQETSVVLVRDIEQLFKVLNMPLYLPNYRGHYERYRNKKYKKQLIRLKMMLSCCEWGN